MSSWKGGQRCSLFSHIRVEAIRTASAVPQMAVLFFFQGADGLWSLKVQQLLHRTTSIGRPLSPTSLILDGNAILVQSGINQENETVGDISLQLPVFYKCYQGLTQDYFLLVSGALVLQLCHDSTVNKFLYQNVIRG